MTTRGSSLAHSPGAGDIEQKSRDPRRIAPHEGFAILEDGKTFTLQITDLSYNGCKAKAAVALLPGLRVKLSLLGVRGALDATVRWAGNGMMGLEFHAEPPPLIKKTPRLDERLVLQADLPVRRLGRAYYRCNVRDISCSGCKVEFVERPRCGELIFVKFEGFDAIEATVRWIDGFCGGVQFARPLYPSIFERIFENLKKTC